MIRTLRHPLDRVWSANEDRTSTALAVIVAGSLHVALAAAVRRLPPPLPHAPTRSMEVELLEHAPPPREDTPPPPAPEPDPVPAPRVASPERVSAPKAAREVAPKPAAAGALMTATDDAADTPVRFVTDPNGNTYGSGIVAANGQGSGRGALPIATATPSASVERPASPPPPRPMPRFATPPRLDERDPCRGSFPRAAMVDEGSARVLVTLGADGLPSRVEIDSEEPKDQGFGPAARDCLRGKRFSPAVDAAGAPVPAKTLVKIRFSR